MRILSSIFGLIIGLFLCTLVLFLYKIEAGVFGVFVTFLAGGYTVYLWFSEMVFTDDYSE